MSQSRTIADGIKEWDEYATVDEVDINDLDALYNAAQRSLFAPYLWIFLQLRLEKPALILDGFVITPEFAKKDAWN